MESYTYTPLAIAAHEIRLLHPESDPSDTTILSFKVQTTELSRTVEASRYYAVSYVWGENVWSGKIYLDGLPLNIPQGAEDALKGVLASIRAARMDMVPLWIDAVCINQDDRTGEKSHQVSIMDNIYARAENVLIWLPGTDDDTGARALMACKALHDECLLWTNQGRDLEANKSLPAAQRQALTYMKLLPPEGCELEEFYSLLRHRWFSRLWVIQEVVLSKQAVLFYGTSHIPWQTLSLAVQWARHRTALWNADCVSEEDFDSLIRYNQIARLRQGLEEMTMAALLTQTMKFDSTDPLDKVYGILGMMKMLGKKSTETDSEECDVDVSSIMPDYRKSVREVYSQAVWLAISGEKSLDLLCHVRPFPDGEEQGQNPWPSWVPHLDLKFETSIVASFSPGANVHNDFEAILYLDPALPLILEANGVPIGTITKTRHVTPEIAETNMYEDHEAMYRHFSYLWDPTFTSRKNTSWTLNLLKTIAVALVCGHYGKDSSNPSQDAETDPSTLRDFAAFMLEMKEQCLLPHNPSLQTLLEQCRPEEGDAMTYTKDVKFFATRFAHFELENARFGVGYKACREGDEVCILFGARQPFVLRKVGEEYRLLGTGYVAGIMKGEYVQGLENTNALETQSQAFRIR